MKVCLLDSFLLYSCNDRYSFATGPADIATIHRERSKATEPCEGDATDAAAAAANFGL